MLKKHLEKEMATHSSILAWNITRKEEPGGLQARGPQRVAHDWATVHKEIRRENSGCHQKVLCQQTEITRGTNIKRWFYKYSVILENVSNYLLHTSSTFIAEHFFFFFTTAHSVQIWVPMTLSLDRKFLRKESFHKQHLCILLRVYKWIIKQSETPRCSLECSLLRCKVSAL